MQQFGRHRSSFSGEPGRRLRECRAHDATVCPHAATGSAHCARSEHRHRPSLRSAMATQRWIDCVIGSNSSTRSSGSRPVPTNSTSKADKFSPFWKASSENAGGPLNRVGFVPVAGAVGRPGGRQAHQTQRPGWDDFHAGCQGWLRRHFADTATQPRQQPRFLRMQTARGKALPSTRYALARRCVYVLWAVLHSRTSFQTRFKRALDCTMTAPLPPAADKPRGDTSPG